MNCVRDAAIGCEPFVLQCCGARLRGVSCKRGSAARRESGEGHGCGLRTACMAYLRGANFVLLLATGYELWGTNCVHGSVVGG